MGIFKDLIKIGVEKKLDSSVYKGVVREYKRKEKPTRTTQIKNKEFSRKDVLHISKNKLKLVFNTMKEVISVYDWNLIKQKPFNLLVYQFGTFGAREQMSFNLTPLNKILLLKTNRKMVTLLTDYTFEINKTIKETDKIVDEIVENIYSSVK